MKKQIIFLALIVCLMAACTNPSKTESTEKKESTKTEASEKKDTPTSKWAGKDKFIEKCAASQGLKEMSKGDAAKAKEMCSCLADKVEAKYPEGMDIEKASKPSVIQEVGADKCFDVK